MREAPGVDRGADARPLGLAGAASGALRADGARPPEAERDAQPIERADLAVDQDAEERRSVRRCLRVPSAAARPASKRSRTNQLIPPHRPADASPMPIQPRVDARRVAAVGPGGKRLAKRSPCVLGRNPATAFDSTTAHTVARASRR